MQGRDIIVVGASAGGVEALKSLAGSLPADLPASVFVVLHVPRVGVSNLSEILSREGRIPAHHAVDGESIEPGRIYIAPPDYHMLFCDGRVVLSQGPREKGHRPSVDVLFRSAAQAYGPRVVGVVLSGVLDDGTAGLAAVKRGGGVSVVQDPAEAIFAGMPQSALQKVAIDHVLPVAAMGPLFARLSNLEIPEGDQQSRGRPEAGPAPGVGEGDPAMRHPGDSGWPLECPSCGGVLRESTEGGGVSLWCRAGHVWSLTGLAAGQDAALRRSLRDCLRVLNDRVALADLLDSHAMAAGAPPPSVAGDPRAMALTIRELLNSLPVDDAPGGGDRPRPAPRAGHFPNA